MKKQLILVFIAISLFLTSCCSKCKKDDKGQAQQHRIDTGAPVTDDDDLIVILYFNVVDSDYKDYTYSFIHNKASGKKVILNKPTETTSTGQKVDLEPSFIVLNFGRRGSLKPTDNVDYDFKIEREKDGTSELLDKFKNFYTYKELIDLNSTLVIQSIKITYNAGTTLPIVINPPIKPTPAP